MSKDEIEFENSEGETFEARPLGKCPFCGGKLYVQPEVFALLHTSPYCKEFESGDPLDFLFMARRKRYPAPEELHAHIDGCEDVCVGREGGELFNFCGEGLAILYRLGYDDAAIVELSRLFMKDKLISNDN